MYRFCTRWKKGAQRCPCKQLILQGQSVHELYIAFSSALSKSKKQPSVLISNTEGCYSLLVSSIIDLTSLSTEWTSDFQISVSYMIIGLTPFLYLHSTMDISGFQDGICNKIVPQFLFKQEKTKFFYKFLLTQYSLCVTMIMLGRLVYRPVLFIWRNHSRCIFFKEFHKAGAMACCIDSDMPKQMIYHGDHGWILQG